MLSSVRFFVDSIVDEGKLLSPETIFKCFKKIFGKIFNQLIFCSHLTVFSRPNAIIVLGKLGKHKHSVLKKFRAEHLA